MRVCLRVGRRADGRRAGRWALGAGSAPQAKHRHVRHRRRRPVARRVRFCRQPPPGAPPMSTTSPG
eukprot:11200730-Lingulodinium_polyedra.AAC.1